MAAASDPVVIVSAARTPLGRFMGDLSPFSAHKLGSHVIGAALERAKLSPELVDEVFMGCVLPAGQGQAPARQAARGAKLPDATGATTINKVCGSGMKATMLAHDIINAGSAEIVLSGGMESMSNAPYLLAKARSGYRAGHDRIIDHMMMDGLEDAYETGRSMGDFGEATAEAYQFTRKDQDTYAMETLTRARKAVEGGAFKAEIAPLTLTEKAGPRTIANDEHPLKVDPAKIPGLKPAFRANGTITPAASSANADGAAALVLAKRSLADRDGLPVLAVIKGHATHSQEPQWFTTAPIPAIRKLLDKVGWSVGDVDLFEINEAFAVVAMAAQRDLGIPREKLNINGGACALGHPIGATGARLLVTLLHALEAQNLKRGVAALCIGGGEAIAIERIVHWRSHAGNLKFHDLQLAVSCPRPPPHPLRLGDGRRDVSHRPDHRRYGRRARRFHRTAANRIRLDHCGDFLGVVDPLHPVRVDGAVRGGIAEPLRPAQRDAVGIADRGLRAGDVAGDDESLAIDVAVGRRGRHRHRHDRAGARRHRCRALVHGAARIGGRDSHRKRGYRTIGIPAAAGQPHRTDGLADRVGVDVRDARDRGISGAAGDVRSSQRSRAAAVRR